MNVVTVEVLLKWIEGTSGPDEPHNVTRARFHKHFEPGTPREDFKEMERNFGTALILHAMKRRSANPGG